MEIRRVILSDLNLIADIFDKYRQFYAKQSDIVAARKFLEERISKAESVIFSAFQDQLLIGFVQLYPTFSSLSMAPLWIVNDLFVLPEFRRRGVAQKLLSEARHFSKLQGARGLTLKTAKANAAAQLLYLSLGWKQDNDFISFHLIEG